VPKKVPIKRLRDSTVNVPSGDNHFYFKSLSIGSSERTETDKNRDLRLKKTKQRKIKKAREAKEKLVDKINPHGNKYSKKAALKSIEQAEKEGRVTTIKEKNKAVKSSKAFFSQMQNEVHTIVGDIKADKAKKRKKTGVNHINAAALKL
jgi:U3 small nucleolar RNA-associated protein MPP10